MEIPQRPVLCFVGLTATQSRLKHEPIQGLSDIKILRHDHRVFFFYDLRNGKRVILMHRLSQSNNVQISFPGKTSVLKTTIQILHYYYIKIKEDKKKKTFNSYFFTHHLLHHQNVCEFSEWGELLQPSLTTVKWNFMVIQPLANIEVISPRRLTALRGSQTTPGTWVDARIQWQIVPKFKPCSSELRTHQ